jgi:hypothetical protein
MGVAETRSPDYRRVMMQYMLLIYGEERRRRAFRE